MATTKSLRVSRSARPTIADVAQRCGVSKGAVSLALNYSPERSRLTAATHQRILRAARELGYRPSWRGRALANQKTHSIGLLYGELSPYLTDAYENMGRIVAQTLWARGYHLIFMPATGGPSHWQDMLNDQRIEGCLVVPPMPQELPQALLDSGTPAVLMNETSQASLAQMLPDDAAGMEAMLTHLYDLGHRRIAYYQGQTTQMRTLHHSMPLRQKVFEQFTAARGIAGESPRIVSTASDLAQRLASRQLNVTAVVAYKASFALDLMHAFWRASVRVPHDVSLATFDDSSVLARLTPPLTTVAVPIDEIGRRCATLMLDSIENQTPLEPGVVLVPERLIVRESTAPPGA